MAGRRGVAIKRGAPPLEAGGRPGRGRHRLWAAVTVVAVLCVLGGAAAETLRLEHRTERALEAQVALANVAHQVDGVRFQAYSMLSGPRPLPSDYAINDGLRRLTASNAATFAGLSPLGAPVETAVNQLNGLVERELQLVAERQPAAAQSIDSSSVGPLYARLVGLSARDTPILDSQAHSAQASENWTLVGLIVGSGSLLVVVVVTFETSRRRRVRAAAEAQGARVSGERFTAMVEHSSDMITVVGPDTTVLYAAPSIGAVLGRDAAHVEGTPLADIVHPDDVLRLWELCEAGSSDGEELRLQHADGTWMTCEARGTRMATPDSTSAVVLNIRDVTGRKALEDQLRHQAFHDALTGLANRALFADRVEHAMTREDRHRAGLAVLMIDLDDFKIVNDSLGHGAGDELLIHVAARLRNCLRSSDTIGRLGGDEFAVLLEDATDICSAEQAADKVRAALAAPIEVAGRPLIVTASIGVATLAHGTTSAEDLLRNADAAMYVAKAQGKNRWTPFQPGMHHAVQERVQLKADLVEALAAGDQMELYYQPVITLDAKAVIGVEALLRWNHPTRGLVPPLDFLAFAEESGIILPLGRWVLRHACLQAREWRSDHPEAPLSMSVNVSGRQLDGIWIASFGSRGV
ncbi:diguanylate cyclase [Acidiferrimicrobium sp. IK]|uniref:putative bifunctional diguanylate cyclase/phosphodiesterase n=1 Tax=Acidiferrimicrobium sp. IK TaxID=2871700 RepID=UPI0021CB457D|nr:diguanylate cyclase [Acidiferrimicrobium sp. IK]MCU4187267.1 diguanylate cyclase [Acidiferrimicrobium sp. IK]